MKSLSNIESLTPFSLNYFQFMQYMKNDNWGVDITQVHAIYEE